MSLVQAQARDWLMYLHSTLWNLAPDPAQRDAALHVALSRESEPVRAVLRHACGRLGWLRWLPTRRDLWGKDFVGLQAVGHALYHLHHPQAPGAITGEP